MEAGEARVSRVIDSAVAVKLTTRELRQLLVDLTGKRRAQAFVGPKALMFAVLEEAIRCYFSSKVRVREEAERWINTTKARTLFSYTVVCETLDLEPSELSARLARLRAQGCMKRDRAGRSASEPPRQWSHGARVESALPAAGSGAR